jgi:hypothetical protein
MDNVFVHGRSTTTTTTADTGKYVSEEVKVTNGQLHVSPGLISGENQTDDRLYGGPAPASKIAITATGAVKASAGKYYGYIVTTALSAAAVTIYDNASAASGTVIDVIPASTAAGTRGVLAAPVPCTNGMYANVAGTGTVLFLYT